MNGEAKRLKKLKRLKELKIKLIEILRGDCANGINELYNKSLILFKEQDLKIKSEAHSFCNDTLRDILDPSISFSF